MCLIFVTEKKWPSEEEIYNAASHNDHGAGIAWVNWEKKRVEYEKGLMDKNGGADEIMKILRSGRITHHPVIIHFRIASQGGRGLELTHPFPLTPQVPLNLSGHAPAVLAHNGTWAGWSDKLLTSLVASKREMPDGDWSDTRAIAWFTANAGIKMLDFLYRNFTSFTGDRVVVLDKEGKLVMKGDWKQGDGFLASNDGFRYGYKRTGYHTTAPSSLGGSAHSASRPLAGDDRSTGRGGSASSLPGVGSGKEQGFDRLLSTQRERLLGPGKPGVEWSGTEAADIMTVLEEGESLSEDHLLVALVGIRALKLSRKE